MASRLYAWRGFVRLHPITRAVLKDRLTYLSIQRLRRLERAIAETREVAGDVVEFGVALGGSGIILAKQAGRSRRFIGFDVFGMIPPPTSEKDDVKSKRRYEIIQSGASPGLRGNLYYGYDADLFSSVKSAFRRHCVPVDGSQVILSKGLFQDTWPAAEVSAISLVHIDCDWYDSVKFCLDSVASKLSDGAVIVVDDYYDYGGCRTAVDEFLAERSEFAFEDGPNPILRKGSARKTLDGEN
jgi:asparagine synthase (glutamine-hydrolysing)